MIKLIIENNKIRMKLIVIFHLLMKIYTIVIIIIILLLMIRFGHHFLTKRDSTRFMKIL